MSEGNCTLKSRQTYRHITKKNEEIMLHIWTHSQKNDRLRAKREGNL